MVYISGISAGYALVAVVASWVRCVVNKAWLFFVSDQVDSLPSIPFWVFSFMTRTLQELLNLWLLFLHFNIQKFPFFFF